MLPHGSLVKLAAGVAAAVIAPVVFRPLLVGLIRAGYEAREATAGAIELARDEVRGFKADVMATREGSADADVRRLRAEVAELRARLAARGE